LLAIRWIFPGQTNRRELIFFKALSFPDKLEKKNVFLYDEGVDIKERDISNEEKKIVISIPCSS